MRPIIALSPILKLLESRFREKLEKYMIERMIPCQVGFVRECGTHVNIIRMIRRCLSPYKYDQTKFRPKAILFIDFKSAYNNVNLDMLFESLKENKILENDEIAFLRTLYTKTKLTIGKEKVEIHRGVMQGSVISPALFNIFIEPLLKKLNREFNIEDIFAYADDIAICVYSIHQMRKAIEIIEEWSNKAGIPINFKKSGILNIVKTTRTPKIIQEEIFGNYPVVKKYKYLGVWLDEKLDPKTHIEAYKNKIGYLINRFRIIPKKSVTPRFLINLWTLVIRPVFDYAFCLAKLKNKTGENLYLSEEMKSFKNLMSLRKSASNELIKHLIGYDPEIFCQEIIRRADTKWTERKGIPNVPEAPINYKIKSDNILITWNTLWYNNLMFSQCRTHHILNSPEHLKNFHYTKTPPSILEILQEGYVVHDKIKKSQSKRKGRLYKHIQEKIERNEKIFKEILDSFKCD
jgi:hypothetical protein